jgi:hypothetical protein
MSNLKARTTLNSAFKFPGRLQFSLLARTVAKARADADRHQRPFVDKFIVTVRYVGNDALGRYPGRELTQAEIEAIEQDLRARAGQSNLRISPIRIVSPKPYFDEPAESSYPRWDFEIGFF